MWILDLGSFLLSESGNASSAVFLSLFRSLFSSFFIIFNS